MVGKGDKRKGIWVDGGHPNTYVILNWFIRESPEKKKTNKQKNYTPSNSCLWRESICVACIWRSGCGLQ